MNPYLVGVLAVVGLWIGCRAGTGAWNPVKLFEGADGASSTSKLQFFLWTAVVLFSYAALWADNGGKSLGGAVPSNLLIAMGMVVGTTAAAKGITVSYVSQGLVTKSGSSGAGGVLADDAGVPDLSKIQVLAWTFVALVAFFVEVVQHIESSVHTLPDIDASLMVLMGLGQGAYLGKKLTTTETPRLTGLMPGSGKPATAITISGTAFGDTQNGSVITVDGDPLGVAIAPADWKDSVIKFTLPATKSNGTPWVPSRVLVGVVVGGRESTNTLPFTVEV